MVEKTAIEYREVIATCKALFEKKTRDYGTAWRILRLPSITDQIFIKAQRIRSIQEKGAQRVDDPIRDEFIGICSHELRTPLTSMMPVLWSTARAIVR